MKWFFIFLFLTAGILYLSNPDMDDFKDFVREQSRELIEKEMATPGLGEALAESASQLAETYVEATGNRGEYYFFSTYQVDFKPPGGAMRKWRFLGVGGTFVNLNKFYDRG